MQYEEVMKFVESLGLDPNEVKSIHIDTNALRVEKFALDIHGARQELLEGGLATHVEEHRYQEHSPTESIFELAQYAFASLEKLQEEYYDVVRMFAVSTEKGFDNNVKYTIRLSGYYQESVDNYFTLNPESIPTDMSIMPVHTSTTSVHGVDNIIERTRKGLESVRESMSQC